MAYVPRVVQSHGPNLFELASYRRRPRVNLVRSARPRHVPFACSYFNLVLHLVLPAVILRVCTHSQQQTLTMAATQYETDLDLVPEDSPKAYKVGTIRDQHDMRRVGKTQELRVGGDRSVFAVRMLKCSLQRNFRLISVLGFTAVLMCTWEAILL